MTDAAVPNDVPTNDIAQRLIQAGIGLLAANGPSAIKARTVAAEAGMSTMVVYNYFGGVPELVSAIVDHGFGRMESAFGELAPTDDAVADLFSMALVTLQFARSNPHLYDAMFGLSTRATYRPATGKDIRRAGHSEVFKGAYAHVTEACARLGKSGRVTVAKPETVAGALWSSVHGFIALELSDHFAELDDPVADVLVPMAVTFCVGLGDDPAAARASHQSALSRFPGL
jgi:AcrR family transcriptional regulator